MGGVVGMVRSRLPDEYVVRRVRSRDYAMRGASCALRAAPTVTYLSLAHRAMPTEPECDACT